jgi:hypothetical protein
MSGEDRFDERYIEVDLGAEKRRVFDLLDELRRAWEKILNDYHEDVPFVDGLMALHNFHKLGLDHIVAEARMRGEPAAQFFLMAAATFQIAMAKRAADARRTP